jgi:hypothetical protein
MAASEYARRYTVDAGGSMLHGNMLHGINCMASTS